MATDQTLNQPEPASLPQPRGGRRPPGWALAGGTALIVLAVFGVCWPALRGQFLWDDYLVVHQNPLLTGRLGLGSIWFHTDFPLTTVGFWLEWLAWGDHPLGYHIVNALLHASSALLLWRLLARLRVPAPWLAAMLFAVHPICVTSVAWISELKNTLSMPFFLLSLLWYLAADSESRGGLFTPSLSPSEGESEAEGRVSGEAHAEGRPRPIGHATTRSWTLYSLSLLAFFLALSAKTSTVMLPAVLLACAWWQRGRISWRDVARSTPFFALALVFGLMTISFQAEGAISGATVQSESFWGRLAGAGMALWFYLGKALLPLHLNMIYPRWKIDSAAPTSYLPLLLWCAVLAVSWRFRRTWGRHLLFALGCFTLLLLPVLGFLDMYFLTLSRVSDHLVYLPLVTLMALVAAALGWALTPKQNHRWTQMDTDSAEQVRPQRPVAPHAPPLGPDAANNNASATSLHLCQSVFICGSVPLWCVGGALILGLGVLATLRARVFVTEEALWRDTLSKNPAAWCAQANLGWILASQQQYDQARAHLEQALALKPDNAQAHANLGRVLALQGDVKQAEEQFQVALALKPKDADIRKTYAAALAEQGRRAEAVSQLQTAVELRAEPAVRLQLAALLHETGQFRQSADEYRQVLAARPDEPEALNNLAWLLATCPDASVRDGASAISLAQRACRLSGYKDPRPLGTLAAAYAEAGRFSDAVTAGQQAIQAATASGDPQLANIGRQLLALFRAGKPYHE